MVFCAEAGQVVVSKLVNHNAHNQLGPGGGLRHQGQHGQKGHGSDTDLDQTAKREFAHAASA